MGTSFGEPPAYRAADTSYVPGSAHVVHDHPHVAGCDALKGSLDAIGLGRALMRHFVPIVRDVVDSAGPVTVYA